jgi:serine/threonine-protein kinase
MSTEPVFGVGSTIGSYRVDALLGRGGMGVVYRAEDLRLGRRVALKVLRSELADDHTYRTRFLRESRLAASIEHAGILPVYEAGELDGLLYIAMRFVDGVDLAGLVRREGPLEPRRAVALVSDLAGALDAAHARGLIHRDVKPSNALVGTDADGEHAYLVDFGITQDTTERERLTATDQLIGTADYLAPERIRGEPSDGRADIYALGCVLFECLTGEPPFGGTSEAALIYGHLEERPRRPSEVRSQVPRTLDAVVARALAKDPADRWQSGSAFRDAAREALAGAPTRRLPRLALRAAAAGVVVLAAGGAVAALLAGGDEREQPQAATRVVALPSESCSPLQYGAGAQPRLLVVSGQPLSGPFPEGGNEMATAVEHVLRANDFKAGRHDLAYQACDEWTDEENPTRCVENAHAYVANRAVVGVVGPMLSECASEQIPVTNRARPGPIAMVSPSNTSVGLTRRGAGTDREEPEVYYPTKVRNYVRMLPAEDLQAAAHAMLARREGARRAFVLFEGYFHAPGDAFATAAPTGKRKSHSFHIL